MSDDRKNRVRWSVWGNVAAAVWMVVTAAVYYLRFTAAFYHDNQSAINDVVEKLGLDFLVF